MSASLTLSPVLTDHLRSLRWKIHHHAAIAFHLEQIAEATEVVAMLADFLPPPSDELAEWTESMKQRAAALDLAVAFLTQRPRLQ